jgi:hypothetical protein
VLITSSTFVTCCTGKQPTSSRSVSRTTTKRH